MSNIKKYTITEWNDNTVVFVVDHDKITNESFHALNNFWSDSESRLDDANGDVVIAVLKMFAEYCLKHQMYHSLNNYGMMSHFGTDDRPHSGVEGYPRMDGSVGILLVSVDTPEIEIDDDVKTEKVDKMPEPPKPNWG
jgi:hypothetical protein